MTSAATSVAALGTVPIPATGVSAVLVQITVTPGSSVGSLYAWATGSTRPAAPSAAFGGSQVSTTTLLVDVGTGGQIDLQTSGQPVQVTIDTLGYVTG